MNSLVKNAMATQVPTGTQTDRQLFTLILQEKEAVRISVFFLAFSGALNGICLFGWAADLISIRFKM